jgi:uncharacterized membrane protein
MTPRRGVFSGLVAVAGAGLWLLLAGPSKVLGIDTGNAGVALLVTVTWVSLHAVSRMPAGGLENEVSPGEWRAWIAFGFTAAIAAYAIAHAHVFEGPPLWQNPDANRVGSNIALLAIAWAILSQVLQARWRGKVQEDERDRQIEARANVSARMTLSVYVIGLAVMFGFSPAAKLAWAPPPMIAHLLIVGLILSCLIEYGVTAASYWRDRH